MKTGAGFFFFLLLLLDIFCEFYQYLKGVGNSEGGRGRRAVFPKTYYPIRLHSQDQSHFRIRVSNGILECPIISPFSTRSVSYFPLEINRSRNNTGKDLL